MACAVRGRVRIDIHAADRVFRHPVRSILRMAGMSPVSAGHVPVPTAAGGLVCVVHGKIPSCRR